MGITDNSVRFTLRIPEELRNTLQKIANGNHRSLNSEMIVILQQECDRLEESSEKDK